MIRPSREVVEHDTQLALAGAWAELLAAVELQPHAEVRRVLHELLDEKYAELVAEIVEARVT